MTAPTLDAVKAYYDERIEGKIRDFTDANPRIEAAIQTLAEWAPSDPKRILEIGCGIGATSWRMARAWPDAEIVGVDISPVSIEVAKTCFREPNLFYRELSLERGKLSDRFDYVILMDVYEHIAVEDRPGLHAALAEVLTNDGRIFLSFPTPQFLQYLKNYHPDQIQPVDEDIALEILGKLANDVGGRLLFYREVSVWTTGDYAHTVVGRDRHIEKLANPPSTLSQRLHSWLTGRHNRKKTYVAPKLPKRQRVALIRPWFSAQPDQDIGQQ